MNHTALSLASSFRIASGTSSPSFVDTRSGECGAGPECDAGVDGSQGLACLSCLPSRFWCAHSDLLAALELDLNIQLGLELQLELELDLGLELELAGRR